jgi:hypothetical protein
MVQILPPRTDVGSAIGAGLGQGLGQGIARGSEIGFQRNLVQQSLKGLENLPPDTNAAQLASHLIQATAGIPGAERYVGQLFPLLLNQIRGQQTQGGLPGSFQGQAQGQVGQQGQFQPTGGYLNPPRNENERLQFAQNYSLGDPTKLKEGLDIANSLSEGSERNLIDFSNRLDQIGVRPEEKPYAMQIAQASKETNPEKLITETSRGLEEIRALDNVLTPGFLRGFVKNTGVFGLVPSLLAGGEKREDALRRLKPVADKMIQNGREPILRDKLAKEGLSRTEIEDLIHPLSSSTSKNIDSLQPPSKKNPENNPQLIADFLKKNVDKNTSLLVLRHKLWQDKGYDWKDIAQGLQIAIDQGLPLTKSQGTELTEFTSQPPRESLTEIFSDFGRFIDYFKGVK